MAGETITSEAICVAIAPWSRTSHIVTWLTPEGKVVTVAKGAVRPKSFLLGQYDLNYTCEIVYYARAKGEVHALRSAAQLLRRDGLRDDYRALALAGYFRRLASSFAPHGSDAKEWYDLLNSSLDKLADGEGSEAKEKSNLQILRMLQFELKSLRLLGLSSEIEAASGSITLSGERRMPVSSEVAAFFRDPTRPLKNQQILLDAARVIGVFYKFHADCACDVRRTVLAMIGKTKEGLG